MFSKTDLEKKPCSLSSKADCPEIMWFCQVLTHPGGCLTGPGFQAQLEGDGQRN